MAALARLPSHGHPAVLLILRPPCVLLVPKNRVDCEVQKLSGPTITGNETHNGLVVALRYKDTEDCRNRI